ncbi:MAG: hypothetical protein IKG03_01195 [Clostridiales bacterium]|nr:hypothetical protein [Clostridiales bacterium]
MRHRIGTEREELFDVNMVIAMRVRIDGELVFGQLEKAFSKAVASYEILNSKMIEENGDAFYVDNDDPQSSFSKTDLSFEELINANEKVRFRLENGEYIRGFLSPDGVVLLMHHMGGDGRSLLFFIETFMSILDGKCPDRIPFANLPVEALPEESRLPYLYGLFVRHWNRRWAKMRRVFFFEDMDKAYVDFWRTHKTRTVIDTYGKEQLDGMLRECREAGCSLTSYLSALWIKDMTRKADAGYAVDGRLDDRRTIGNFATGIHINCRYDRNKSVMENAVKINSLMKRKLADPKVKYSVLRLIGSLDPTLVDTLSLEAAGAYHTKATARFADIMCYGKKKRDISITNLMRADIRTDYGRFRIRDIAFVPPVVSYGTDLIGIITVNDTLTITRHVYE